MSKNGDADYREELARLTPNLRRFARALVQDHQAEAADDLVQATLVQALGSSLPRRGSRLTASLLVTLLGLHRAQLRDVSADKVSAHGASQNGSGRSGRWDLHRGRSDTASLGTMPLESREVFLLVALEGLSYAQAAEALGLSLNAVVVRLSQAREHLGQAHRGVVSGAGSRQTPREPVPYLRVVK